jgi:hypothetical protein
MLNNIIVDVLMCATITGPLWSKHWLLVNVSKMACVMMFIVTLIAVLSLFAIFATRSQKKKAFNKKELEKCKGFRFNFYEPFSDLCIAFSLCAIGRYVLGAVYFLVVLLIRSFKTIELQEYEDEENGSESN